MTDKKKEIEQKTILLNENYEVSNFNFSPDTLNLKGKPISPFKKKKNVSTEVKLKSEIEKKENE